MRDALNATGRPIFYSICNWGEENTTQWAAQIGNAWRTTMDITTNFTRMMLYNYKENMWNPKASGPGGWNDPDMLEVGVHSTDGTYNLTITEEKTHFALWALMKAPLIIGADLRTIRPESLDILRNKELIAVNQDPVSHQALCF